MPLKYKLVARKVRNPQKPTEERTQIYANAVASGKLTMEQICTNIERNSTATRGEVKGIALAFANALAKSLTEGNSVYLEDLGYFRVGLTSEGALSEEKFVETNITDKYINYQPTGKLVATRTNVTFERVGESKADDSLPAE